MYHSLKPIILAFTTIAGTAVAVKYNFQKQEAVQQAIPSELIKPVLETMTKQMDVVQSAESAQGWKDLAFSFLLEYKKEAAAGIMCLMASAMTAGYWSAYKNANSQHCHVIAAQERSNAIASGLVAVASAACLVYAYTHHEAPSISI